MNLRVRSVVLGALAACLLSAVAARGQSGEAASRVAVGGRTLQASLWPT